MSIAGLRKMEFGSNLKTSVLFPPGWLERTSRDPKLAQEEILHLTLKMRDIQAENSRVRKQRDRLECRLTATALSRDQESARARNSECAHEDTQNKLEGLEKLRSHLETKVRSVELERDTSNLKSDHMKRRLCKVEGELRAAKRESSGVNTMKAIKKLTLNHSVGKRLAAVVHPDKVPTELSESASELFQFLQTIRESSEGLSKSV